jgi:hypothetical protein
LLIFLSNNNKTFTKLDFVPFLKDLLNVSNRSTSCLAVIAQYDKLTVKTQVLSVLQPLIQFRCYAAYSFVLSVSKLMSGVTFYWFVL